MQEPVSSKETGSLVYEEKTKGKKMKKLGAIFLIFLATFLAACGASQRPALQHNRSLWESQAIQHYRFSLNVSCLCPWVALMPLTIEVQNGRILSMVASNGGDITQYQDTFRQNGTIENLFDLLNSAISKRVYKLVVQYDPKYGFPASIDIDPSRMIIDDETGYYVTNFEVLP
jgi:hypothetical protein